MNDRYLFRGKRTDNGEWVYGSYIPKWYDGARISSVIIVDENSEDKGLLDELLVKYYIDPETIGQCTGLKDKNGILFFEGDKYIGCDGNVYEVEIHGFCCFEDAGNCEIIGNVHEEEIV